MSLKQTIFSAVDAAIVVLGDLIVDAQAAKLIPTAHVPGAIQVKNFDVYPAIVAMTTVDAQDFPGTSIEVFDRSLIDIKPNLVTNPGDVYNVMGETFRVVKSNHTFAGGTAVVSQHLVRPEKITGVAWA